MITAEEARALFDYNPETGVLTWRVSRGSAKAGQRVGHLHQGYRKTEVSGARYLAHHIVWLIFHGEWPSGDIDHINGTRDDNRIANLRIASNRMNQENQRKARKDNRCGLLGVTVSASGRYTARIRVEGKNAYLGSFNTPEEAHAAYLRAKRLYHEGCTI